jgi:dihydroflavonol-4-reductase
MIPSAAMDGVDWVFHVAAVADYRRQNGTARLYQVNVGGTRHVLETAISTGVRRVVFTSSAASLGVPPVDKAGLGPPVQGEAGGHGGVLLDESATFNLPPSRFPYGHSKHLAERIVQDAVAQGLQAVIVNPTVILGPKDLNLNGGSIIREVYRRRVPAIPPGGANYIDVADVVAGHIAAAERGRPGERYILGRQNLTHRQAARIVAEIAGAPPLRLQLPLMLMEPLAIAVDLINRIRPDEPLIDGNGVRYMKHRLFFDSSKAESELALGPSTPFRVSVERTFRWYRDNGYL